MHVLSIDPITWLTSHGFTENERDGGLYAISVGDEAIAACGGDIALALAEAPDLQAEIILAYALSLPCLDDESRVRLKALSGFVGGVLED